MPQNVLQCCLTLKEYMFPVMSCLTKPNQELYGSCCIVIYRGTDIPGNHLYLICSSLYRVSQEECARLRESVPYVIVYRYNPKHQYPKLNGYRDNGQRKVGASCGSKYCNLHSWYVTWQCERPWQWNAVFTVPAWRFVQSAMLRHRWAFSCIVLVTLRTTMTRVRVFL